MDKKSAIHLIESTFNAKFSEEQFTVFAKNLLNDLEQGEKVKSYSGNYIWDDYKEHINSYKRIGKYIDPNGEALDVLIVQVESSSKLERARTTLRNFIIKHLDKFEKDYALVAFYSNEDSGVDWRFSFVKLEHQSYFDEEKGKVKNKKEFTPAKRYSFLVGEHEKAHTAKNQILPLLQNVANNPTVEQLEDAFSIERVTDEFFEQYKDLYTSLSAHFENDSHTKSALEEAKIENDRFTKKLLGQIVFLYFLQKKGWLGVPKNEPWGKGKKNFVQELFNQSEKAKDNFFKDKLQFLFYEALAKERDNENSYYPKFECRIPFLNGGLFEADYKWKEANISIPSRLFRNQDKNKSGDIGTGVLDVFDRYNFTIKEDEPLDKEVAVDPEMLGKVFENMLPENERKGLGAFYTPRVVVHYMCQQTLIQFLLSEVNDSIDETDIRTFIQEGHLALENDIRVAEKGESRTYKYQLPQSIRDNAELLDQKLSEVRICDPAIGSGAFPVGLLHELVVSMLVLKPHFTLDYNKKKLDSFGFAERESVNESRYVYRLKRHIIQESIYGVDIDASAIDIARLRLWLSLVVDEDDLDPIETLPNLDYKIVCGNSLIGLPENAMHDLKVEKELEVLKGKFYNETNEIYKRNLRNEINAKIRELLDSAEQYSGYHIAFDFKLYFSEVWHEQGGFDIVIGNPPYGVSIKGDYRKIVLKQFEKVPDYEIYYFFTELARRLLKSKGTASYIIPNTILFNVYALKYREKVLKQWKVNEILDCTPFKLFDSAVVRNIIFNWTKEENGSEIGYRNSDEVESFREFVSRPRQFLSNKEISTFNQNWALAFKLKEDVVKIIKHIKAERKTLKATNPEISQGLIAYDKYRGQSQEVIETRAFHHTEFSEGLKKWLLGEDVTRYKVKWNGQHYIDYCNEIANPRDPKYFIGERVLIREITNPRIYASYTSKELYNDPAILIIKSNERGLSALTLTGIINSDVATFLHFNNSPKATKGDFPKILINDLKEFPVPEIDQDQNRVIETLVSYLVFMRSIDIENTDFEFIDELVNAVVYELYFFNEMDEAKKTVLKHLHELPPLEVDTSTESKLAIIKSITQEFSKDKHPIRFALETIDSVESVRVIKSSLR